MDMLAVCSLYEGLAYVMLEALFAGLPIISTPVGGTREAVVDGINGIVVPHDAPEELAAAIRRLAADAQLRRSMASASRHRAEQFTIPRMVEALERLYFETRERANAHGPGQTLAAPHLPTTN
jgi:glycosyltransferase involved in cell wall biosynthesis